MYFITKRLPKFAKFAAVASLAALAACSETHVAPTANALVADTPNPAQLADDFVDVKAQFGWLPWITPTTTMVADTAVQTFVVNPSVGALINFDVDSKVVIYPNAICDPATSGYGPNAWNLACKRASSSITFTFKSYKTPKGRPAVKISPDVRFAPGSFARIYFHDATLTNFSSVVIPWCNASGSCVDEGANDPYQKTWYAPGIPGYWIFRSLRHFSGYNVWA